MTLDLKALRSAFGRFLTGVTVVTTRAPDGAMLGFTANSFSSVSLDPPLLLVCPGNHLSGYDVFCNTPAFGISILSEGQEDVSNLFASGTGDRFAAVDWDTPTGDVPLIGGRAAGFVCDTHDCVAAGDHVILIGRVTHFDDATRPGLGYSSDGYFNRLRDRHAEAPPTVSTRASALLEDDGKVLLTEALDLPTVDVPAGQSPLQTLFSDLKTRGITSAMNNVYAVYEEGRNHRRIVFRGTARAPQPGLTALPIDTLPQASIPDPALKSLLARFAQEHAAQSFGLYIGDEEGGDVLPGPKE